MKSAYEIAMEKLNRAAGPSKKLTDDQRKRIADIDAAYEARIAETRLSFDQKLATAEPGDRDKLQEALTAEVAGLEEKREEEKEVVWNEAE